MKTPFGWMVKRCSFVKNQTPSPFTIWKSEQRVSGKMSLISQRRFHRAQQRTASLANLIGAATSVGANCVEADDSVSKREFLKCSGTCKKEARETKYFLRMAVRAVPKLKPEARKLWMEARELHLIFAKIWRSGKQQEQGK
jgi:four helix bundle protein